MGTSLSGDGLTLDHRPCRKSGVSGDTGAVHLTPVERSEAVTWWKRWTLGPTLGDRSILYQELASLTGAGIGIQQAVHGLHERAGGRRRRALALLDDAVAHGVPPGEAMARLPDHFAPVEAHIVAAGERTGRLDRAFRDAAAEADRARQSLAKLLRSTAYPVFLLHFALFIPGCVLMQNAGGARAAQVFVWGVFLAFWAAVAVGTTFHVARRNDPAYGHAVARLPLVGAVTKSGALARATRVASLLHDAGADLPTSLRAAAGASGNGWIAAGFRAAADRVQQGELAAAALAAVTALGSESRSLIETGEVSGNLDESFARIAQIEEDRFDAATRRLAVGLGGLLFATAAIIVAVMYVSVIGGYYAKVLSSK